MKNSFKLFSLILLVVFTLTACRDDDIVVVSREEGSGTRNAFIELTGILEKTDTSRVDKTTKEAITQMQTETVIQSVAGNENAIGYISTGSLSDTVKTLRIDGIEASGDNIANGEYALSRPFLLATKNENPLIVDFLSFVLSNEGQDIVSEKYIPVSKNEVLSYKASNLQGNITIAGSTSVAPIIEPLAEEYMKLNPKVSIEIQQTGSSAGLMSVADGTAHIGMSSRKLSPDEEEDLKSYTLALDGIAIIVNNANNINNLSMEDIYDIFTGDTIDWKLLEGGS